MPDRSDDNSDLETADSDHPLGNLMMPAGDMARTVALPDLDYDSQLIAIRTLLDVHRQAEGEYTAEIKRAEQLARSTFPSLSTAIAVVIDTSAKWRRDA